MARFFRTWSNTSSLRLSTRFFSSATAFSDLVDVLSFIRNPIACLFSTPHRSSVGFLFSGAYTCRATYETK